MKKSNAVSKNIPEFIKDYDLYKFRKDEWSFLVEVATLDCVPFRTSDISRNTNTSFNWTYKTVKRLENAGVITNVANMTYTCDLVTIKDIVEKLKQFNMFGLSVRQAPLLKIAFYVYEHGDYYELPSYSKENEALKSHRKYIDDHLTKSEALDLFTVFEKETTKYLILKKKALDIIDFYKEVSDFIKTSMANKTHQTSSALHLQTVWNNKTLGE